MKNIYWTIIVFFLVLALLWFFSKLTEDTVEPKVAIIDCNQGDSFADIVNGVPDGHIIKLVSNCIISNSDFPAVVTKNNIIIDGSGRTITGTINKNTLEIKSTGVIVRNITFKGGLVGLKITGSAFLDNVSTTQTKKTGVLIQGSRTNEPLQKYSSGNEKLKQYNVANFCNTSSNRFLKNSFVCQNSFSLFRNAMAQGVPSAIEDSSIQVAEATVCGGDWSNNIGEGGVIDAAYVSFNCGSKIVKINQNGLNGLVVRGVSTVEILGTDKVEANNNAIAGLDIDDNSYMGIANGTLNTNNNQTGTVIKGSSFLDIYRSSAVISNGNTRLDLEISDAAGDGSIVLCEDSVFNAENKSENSVPPKFECNMN